MAVAYSKTDKSITVIVGFVPKTIPSTHPNYAEIVRLAQSPNTTEQQITPLLDIAKTIIDSSGGDIEITNGKLFFRGFELKSSVAVLILQLLREGNEEGAQPYKNFLAKAVQNPDPRATNDLFDWVVHSKLPITPDGDILAWKAVRDDYLSIRSGPSKPEFDHHVGNTVEQDRKLCDPDPSRTCSRGLHFAAADYLSHYGSGGSRIVAVKISPADVVAFPTDYGWSKGRAWKYVVVGEVPIDKVPDFYPQGRRISSAWEAPKPASKPTPATPGESKPGDVWQRRDGKETVITDIGDEQSHKFPVVTADHFYTGSGRYLAEHVEHPLDLVKFVR